MPTFDPDPTVLRPQVSRYENREVQGRMQAVSLAHGQSAALEWTTRHPSSGDPVDITSLGSSSSSLSSGSSASVPDLRVLARIREALYTGTTDQYEVTGEVTDPAAGLVRIPLAPPFTNAGPGVYLCEIGYLAGTTLLLVNRLYVLVERGLFGPSVGSGGPYTSQEIALALKNSAREDSYLLDEKEWDPAEICQAVLRPVQWFNESQPPIPRKYTTRTFPFRDNWLQGTMAVLYEMAAVSYRREHVSYSSAGVALNDKQKAPEYEAKATELRQAFQTWARTKKAQMNAEGCVGSVGLYWPPY